MRGAGLNPKIAFALVLLLLLAQWTGFWMVLCVSGPGHVHFELAGSPCCAPAAPAGAGLAGGGDSCAGCTDMTLESASSWNSPRNYVAPDTGVTHAAAAATPAGLIAAEPGLEASGFAPASPPPILSAPLRC